MMWLNKSYLLRETIQPFERLVTANLIACQDASRDKEAAMVDHLDAGRFTTQG